MLALPAGSLYYEYHSGASCARCHEIRRNYDAWHASSHRDVACGACHGEITTLDAGFHLGNLRRLVQHVRQGFADPVRLGAARHSAIDGAMPRVPPPGVRRSGNRGRTVRPTGACSWMPGTTESVC